MTKLNEINKQVPANGEGFFHSIMDVRIALLAGVANIKRGRPRLYHVNPDYIERPGEGVELTDNQKEQYIAGFPPQETIDKGTVLNGIATNYADALFEVMVVFQNANMIIKEDDKKVAIDKVIEDTATEAETYFACCNDDMAVIELCNIALSRTGYKYNFMNKEVLDIDPLGIVCNILTLQSIKHGDDLEGLLKIMVQK